MTWLRIDAAIGQSRLVDILRNSCGVPRNEMIGALVSLSAACLAADNHGDLSRFSDAWIEDAADWHGPPGQFAAVIREHHLIDGRIKSWDDYQGKLEQRRAADRARKRGPPRPDVRWTSAGTPAERRPT